MQIIELKTVVANATVCRELLALGVINAAALAWEPDGVIVGSMDASEEAIPAYSLDELAIALGNFFPLPCLTPHRPKAAPDEDITWNYYFPEVGKTFENGASAAAAALVYCIEKGLLTAEKANNRIERKFKPF